MTADALFAPDPAQVRMDDLAGLSEDRRRTVRQQHALADGQHPLSLLFGHMPLHDQAAPADDRNADGRRCGNCVHRELAGRRAHVHPKCGLGGDGARITHGPGTDCRAWWPACRDHEHAEVTDDR